MTYHIARDGTQLGTFTLDQVTADLASGKLLPTDLGWHEGMGDWAPLSSLVQPAVSAPPAIPAARPSPQIPVSAMPAIPAKTSGLAVASLVCGILTLFCSFITGIPAIIMGLIALNKIGKSQGALGGKGAAVAGIVCGGVLIVVGAVLMGLAVPAFNQVQERARLMQASSNARQIVISLKSYAGDNNGKYPDADKSEPQTSNDAFRLLFVAGLLEDERAFTVANSPFEPDNDIGEAPDYKQALEAEENHWAMTKGLTDSSDGNAPLIFENAVGGGTWPPWWNCDQAGQKVVGRAWKSGKIIIARNDGSVAAEQLESIRGTSVMLKPGPDGKDLFTRLTDMGEYLDVVRK